MPFTPKSFAASSCSREWSEPVEKTSEDILTIHDSSAGRWFGAKTAINLADRTITKTWNVAGLTWRRSCALDDYTSAEIQDKSRLMEGYELPLFVVSLSGKGRRLKIFSTDDFEDAKALQREVIWFLTKAGVSTLRQQSG